MTTDVMYTVLDDVICTVYNIYASLCRLIDMMILLWYSLLDVIRISIGAIDVFSSSRRVSASCSSVYIHVHVHVYIGDRSMYEYTYMYL